MPTSGFQISRAIVHRNSMRGFTLIEILVVLLLITILAGLTVSRLPAFAMEADFDRETRRLELLLNMARSDARLDSVEYGFRTTNEGYEFLLFDDASQKWVVAQAPFRARQMPDEITLRLRVDDENINLPGDGLPPLLILSSGETTPFRLAIESRTQKLSQTLTSDGYGPLTWETDD